MHIKFWGTRGSLPSPLDPSIVSGRIRSALDHFLEAGLQNQSQIESFLSAQTPESLGGYGGNTTCIEVTAPGTQIIIDCGTGLRPLGYEMLSGPAGKGKAEIHILMTHFHWDHLMGLGFFVPLFIPGNKVHFYAVQPELERIVRLIFTKPMFPVEFEKLGAKIQFHTLEPRKPFKIGEVQATPYLLDHPDPCWGYKFEHAGKAFSHCVDTEATRTSKKELGPDLPLYQGIELMVFDAQYTLVEAVEKIDWGHAAATLGLDIAHREKIKRVLFMHHDPAASDEKISSAALQVKKYNDSQKKAARREGQEFFEVEWQYIYDGFTVEV